MIVRFDQPNESLLHGGSRSVGSLGFGFEDIGRIHGDDAPSRAGKRLHPQRILPGDDPVGAETAMRKHLARGLEALK